MTDGFDPITKRVLVDMGGGRKAEVELEPAYCYVPGCGDSFWAFPGVPTSCPTEKALWDGVRDGTIKTSMRVQTCRKQSCAAFEQRRQEIEWNEIQRIKNRIRKENEANAPSAIARPRKGSGGNASGASIRQAPAEMQPLLPDDEGNG